MFFFIGYLITLAYLLGMILWSALCMKEKFNFGTVCVSNLGNKHRNPTGYKGFWWGFGISGFLVFPHLIAFYPVIALISPIFASIILTGSIIGAIGMSGVGFVNEVDQFKPHFVLGVCFFLGFGIAILATMLLFLLQVLNHATWPSLGEFIFVFMPLLFAFLYILYRLAFKPKGLANMNKIEWILLGIVLYWNLAMNGIFMNVIF